MKTDWHLISPRLESLSEEELGALYRKLIRVTTGSEPADGAGIDRVLHLLETTDSERGALLSRLLGNDSTESAPWVVGPSPGHLHLDRTIAFRSAPEQFLPRYYIGDDGNPLTPELAANLLSTKDPETETIIVERFFPSLPSGWTLVSRPPLPPRDPLTALIPESLPPLWVLVCRNPTAAESILQPILESGTASAPLLIAFDDPGPDVPQHVRDIRSCRLDEAPELLSQFFVRSELLLHPGKRQLVRAITSLHVGAAHLLERQQADTLHHESLKLALDRAELAWQRMFIYEQREAVRDLRINVVAHPFLKTRMILTSEREAQVTDYLRRHLAPLIENFIKSQALELAQVQLNKVAFSPSRNGNAAPTQSSHLRAGILMALPNLALLTPTLMFEPTKVVTMIKGGAGTDVADSGSQTSAEVAEASGDGVLDFGGSLLGSLATAVAAKLAPLLEQGKGWLSGVLKEQFAGIERQLGAIDNRLGQLLGILVAGQIAVAIAAIIGTVIMIKGTLSLTQAEELIKKLLKDVEAEWPRIRQSLEALVPELDGHSSELLASRAKLILTELESI